MWCGTATNVSLDCEVDIDTTIAEMNGYQLRRHRIIIERLCPIYQERKRNQMED